MPDQRMSMHDHIVADRKLCDAIRSREIEYIRGRFRILPFQMHLGNEDVRFSSDLFEQQRVLLLARCASGKAELDTRWARKATKRRS